MKNEAGAVKLGWRELGDKDGWVIHLRLGAGLACRTRGAHAASGRTKDVNCAKCMVVVAKIRGHVCGGDLEMCARRCPEPEQTECERCHEIGAVVKKADTK